MLLFSGDVQQKGWNSFSVNAGEPTLHNILIAAEHAVPLVKAEKGQGHDSQPHWMGSDLSPFLCFPPSVCRAKNRRTRSRSHTRKPHRESRLGFTLPLKMNDTSNVADGCNQKFKQQAASLSLSVSLGCGCQAALQQCVLWKARPVSFIILSPFNLQQSHLFTINLRLSSLNVSKMQLCSWLWLVTKLL